MIGVLAREKRPEYGGIINRQVQPMDKGLSSALTQTRKKQTDVEVWALLQEAGNLGLERGNWAPGDEYMGP